MVTTLIVFFNAKEELFILTETVGPGLAVVCGAVTTGGKVVTGGTVVARMTVVGAAVVGAAVVTGATVVTGSEHLKSFFICLISISLKPSRCPIVAVAPAISSIVFVPATFAKAVAG